MVPNGFGPGPRMEGYKRMSAPTNYNDGTATLIPLRDHDNGLSQEAHRKSPRLPAFCLALALVISLVEIFLLARTNAFTVRANPTLRVFCMAFHPWFWVTSIYWVWCTSRLVLATGRLTW